VLVKLADMVAYIFSYSFRMGVVPEHWKRSFVTTVVMSLHVATVELVSIVVSTDISLMHCHALYIFKSYCVVIEHCKMY